MDFVVRKVRAALYRVFGWVPQKMPVGGPAWNRYCSSLLAAYGFPNLPSYRLALAQMIMHLPQTSTRIAPRRLALQLKNGQVKETVYQEIHDHNERVKKAKAAEKAAIDNTLAGKQSESGASDGAAAASK